MPQTETKLPTAKEVLDTIKVITDDYAEKKHANGAMILDEVDGHYYLLTPTAMQELTYSEYQDYKQMLERNNN